MYVELYIVHDVFYQTSNSDLLRSAYNGHYIQNVMFWIYKCILDI